MPSRTTHLVTGEYYHVFNRGVAKMPIFNTAADYKRFIQTVRYYQIDGLKPRFALSSPQQQSNSNARIVEIATYCLMPNHFHMLLQQKRDRGISEFIQKLTNSYGKYFNKKHKRIGPLLQGRFKAVRIETDEQLVHVSRYIHLNPLIGYVIRSLDDYRWSSYHEYSQFLPNGICEINPVISQFPSKKDYIKFVHDQEDYAKKLDFTKHLLYDSEDN